MRRRSLRARVGCPAAVRGLPPLLQGPRTYAGVCRSGASRENGGGNGHTHRSSGAPAPWLPPLLQRMQASPTGTSSSAGYPCIGPNTNRRPAMSATPFDTLRPLPSSGGRLSYHSLPVLEEAGVGRISRLPVSIRIVLEAVLRHCDGEKVTADHVRELAGWQPETGAPPRSPSWSRAWCCRTSPACRSRRPRRDAQRGRRAGPRGQAHRPAGAGRPGRRPLGAGGPLRHARRTAPQHGDRVRAQPRALPVHEVGHAGLRHLPRGAAGHRHRATRSTSNTSSAACARATACATPTRWWAPTPTPP